MDDLQSRLAHWQEHLAGAPTVQLPTDYPRPVIHQLVEVEESLRLAKGTSKSLLQASLTYELSPFSFIMAAMAILLHKYTREEDVVIGSSSSTTRSTLVLRLPVAPSDTFEQVLQRTVQEDQHAQDHEVPFQELYSRLRPATDDGVVAPLFQVRMFNVVDVDSHTLEATSCDWTIYVEQLSDSRALLPLRVRVVFNTILFARERIIEMLRQLELVLVQGTANPTMPISQIQLVTEGSRFLLPNPSEALDGTFFGSIQSIFSKHAEERPDRVAIVDNRRSYSYAEVDARSNQVANFLIGKGISRGDVVAIFAHRSTPIVYAILGILKAGAAFTVIDPAYPPERQIVYLRVAQPKALITIKKAGALVADVIKYIDESLTLCGFLSDLTEDETALLDGVSAENPDIEVGPDDIGTLSFTSGSTGIPKGVRGRHISYTHFYPWMMKEFDLSEADRFSLLSGIAHDPIQRDIFTPFFMGASIHIPDYEDIHSPGRLSEWMAQQGITVTHLTPAMGQLLAANAMAKMPGLKMALLVGDILTKRDVMRLQALAPNIKIVNMYGTTETQRAVSYLTVLNDSRMSSRKEILPAGRGMKDVQLLILTPDMKLCGVGEMGEIFSRSPHMAAGYLGLEEATAAKFIVNPFNPTDPTDRMYRTGDIGRYMPDGIVECAGRADDQVKIRGFRIELGEIDTHLSQHPDVRENVTVVRRDIDEEHVLVSYFVPTNDDFDVAKIRTHLREKLPGYAVPTLFVPLKIMPLTPNGKIDRTKLPFPDTAKVQKPRGRAASVDKGQPQTLEARLIQIWSALLRTDSLDVNDNFFDVGGHSIIATRLVFQMRQELRLDLPLMMLFDYPTVALMAEAIRVMEGDVGYERKGDADAPAANSVADVEAARKPAVNLAAEVVLPDDITGEGRTFTFVAEPSDILLTGATGFLGAFLLRSLLDRHPKARVHCLVRGDSEAAARERVVRNLDNHHLLDASDEAGTAALLARVVIVQGDLGLERLGMSESAFESLGRTVQCIIHNGALVHWVYPYEKLKAANVGSTVELLRLATVGELKPLHFVSSTSVFDSDFYINLNEKVREDDDLTGGIGLTVGYGQSKWVAERLVLEARRRGVPVTITRPGYVVGSTATGVTNSDDFVWRLAKGCIQLGSVPLMYNTVNMCSVDYVADAIVHFAAKKESIGNAFHMTNPDRFRFVDFFNLLSDYGYKVHFIEYMRWRQDLMEFTMASNDSALYPLMHFVLDDLPTRTKAPELDAANAVAALADTEIKCRPMEEVMGTYFSYLIASGFLPPPAGQGAKRELPKLNVSAKMLSRTDR